MTDISFDKYILAAKSANKHPAKATVLNTLLKEVFDVELIDLLPGVEKNVKVKALDLSGSIDLLFKNVVFEIKTDLQRELGDAEYQLENKYFAALFEEDNDPNLIGIATDVIDFIAYKPIIENDQIVGIKEISSLKMEESSNKQIFLWLDSFIFSKTAIKPEAEDLQIRFGLGSPTYALIKENFNRLYGSIEDLKQSKLKFELWEKSMELVYGNKPTKSDFIDHTYLVVLVKLITSLKLSGKDYFLPEDIKHILDGIYFRNYGIINFIEEDFFSWLLNPKILEFSSELIAKMGNELKYDFSQMDEDFFKEIYQEIVSRAQRHSLGEYYTPEWLTELLINNLFMYNHVEKPRILDPACGSGTFLSNLIRSYRSNSENIEKEEIRKYILNNIIGVDINPLAIIISRANYILALDDLMLLGEKTFLPVYFADSIKLPKTRRTILGNMRTIEYEFQENTFIMPFSVVQDRIKLINVIETLKEAINIYKNENIKSKSRDYFKNSMSLLSPDEMKVLLELLETILILIDANRDSIWAFMLNNIYITTALAESKFDIILGNPPWIALRFIENSDYQNFIKKQVLNYKLIEKKRIYLYPHMEMATLFFCRTADLYLKNNGLIGFVMPRSILTGAFHHINFKKFEIPKIKLLEIIDQKGINPLFKTPSCSIIGIKGQKNEYPVKSIVLSGKLPNKNMKLNEVNGIIKLENSKFETYKHDLDFSFYHNKFKEGATLVPRIFWFIEFQPHPTFGLEKREPLVRSKKLSDAKAPWKDYVIEGKIDSKFIYSTILGAGLWPFRADFSPVVLPIIPKRVGYKLIDVLTVGKVNTENWLKKAQEIYEKEATSNAKKDYPRLVHYADIWSKMTTQDHSKKFTIIFNRSGTNLTACVVDMENIPPFEVEGVNISSNGFIVDSVTYYFKTDDIFEAHYLCSILNSNVINEAKMDLQTEGEFGKRDIYSRGLMFPIPEFDKNNELHVELTNLSLICHKKSENIQMNYKKIGLQRLEIKNGLKEEIKKIDQITATILDL